MNGNFAYASVVAAACDSDWRGVSEFAGVGAYDLRSDASGLTPIDEQMEIRQ